MALWDMVLTADGIQAEKRPRPPLSSLPCPQCGRETKTLETRGNRRRRVCPDGHTHHTQEISEAELYKFEVWVRMSKARTILREKGYLCNA